MSKELKDTLQKLSEDEELSSKLEDLYENDLEGFAEKCLDFLKENGIELAEESLKEPQEISLEELEQISGGMTKEMGDRFVKDLLKSKCGESSYSWLFG